MGNITETGASSRRLPAATLTALLLFAACGEAPTEPTALIETAPAFDHDALHQSYESGSHVLTWDPIILPVAMGLSAACGPVPAVGLNADWQNQHNAYDFGLDFAAFQTVVRNKFGWQAPWINAWNSDQSSTAPGDSPLHDENWTRYSTQVEGDGDFVLRLSADNCSWIYLDGILVGTQSKDPRDWDAPNPEFGVTLSGTHTLEFIVFDGGGQAGGMFEMETTSSPPPPLNEDLDDDGHDNDVDAFPLDPNEWADTDGDGVGDNADAFDGSDTRPSLVIGACDSGVANRHLGNGTWFSDLVGAAKASAANHGQFVSAVAALANEWKKAGMITGQQQGAIVSCAARSK